MTPTSVFVFLTHKYLLSTTAAAATTIDYHDIFTRERFLHASLDTTGKYLTTAAAVPKSKGYLRRDDGRRDNAAPDTFAALSRDTHNLECVFLTAMQSTTMTTPYVTTGVVLDTNKVLTKDADENAVSASSSATLVAVGTCGWSTAVLDLTASTTSHGDVLDVYCPNPNAVATATCHAEASRLDSNLPATVTVASPVDNTTTSSSSSSSSLRLRVTSHTLFTCLITCQSTDTASQTAAMQRRR